MAYQTQQKSLSVFMMNTLKEIDEDGINIEKYIATLCIEGFKEEKVKQMIEYFRKNDFLSVNKKTKKIYRLVD